MMFRFLKESFERAAGARTYADPLEDLLCNESITLCTEFDQTHFQESWSWRNTHMARELATYLIDEKGELKRRVLLKAMRLLESESHSLGPNRHHDAHRLTHVLKVLRLFSKEQVYSKTLKRIYRPENHQGAIQLIRETLFISEKTPITHAHARRAAFSALLTELRQSVGSCFATAPAIMIQQEQPLQFLSDIGQLFATGRLTRVYEGVEYTVPLSVNWGAGDLYRPIPFSSLGRDPLKSVISSPGLKAAFEASRLENPFAESSDWIEKFDPFSLVTADTFLKQALLGRHGVTEEEVKEHQERPVEGLAHQIMIQTPHQQAGKGAACTQFLNDYEKGKNAFKSLTDNALLKSWEFTLASLSESKADCARWNLYISLGIEPEEPFGIGQSIQEYLQKKIDQLNDELEEYQSRYDHLFAQAKYVEGRIRRASASELEWLRADYRLRQQEINRTLSERDEAHDKGQRLSKLFPFLVDFYGKKMKDYFQEVYDAEMLDVNSTLYDDSPAGFRLLYKHGRAHTALWSLIHNSAEYIQHLSAFFVATENELRHLPEMEGIEQELSELVTTIITTIKRPEFLESSYSRLARAYKEPLKSLEQVKRKPWVYVSGGTMGTLISCYYGSSHPPTEVRRWVESPTELLAFFIDTMRELPHSTQRLYEQEQDRSLLASSPTHAFLCKPGWNLFRQAWESDLYTYTWIRDLWNHPQQRFLDENILDSRMMDFVFSELLNFIPSGYQAHVQTILKGFPYSMRSNEFREYVIRALSYEKWLRPGLIAEELDAILYRSLPLFPEHALTDRLRSIFKAIEEIDDRFYAQLDERIETLDVGRYQIFSAAQLRDSAKALLIQVTGSTRSSIPFHQKITGAMQKLGFAYPEPFLIADTNWVKNTFGFTVNPGTGNVEFWRFDDCGSEGKPIVQWRRYLNGVDRQEWGLYTVPSEYGQFFTKT
ncbi:MAG: hypothetical protein S4CHLAM2_14010 [Chlamydiales bacterium]|nr:hypothetical protein [Chlamydiales bacterium]